MGNDIPGEADVLRTQLYAQQELLNEQAMRLAASQTQQRVLLNFLACLVMEHGEEQAKGEFVYGLPQEWLDRAKIEYNVELVGVEGFEGIMLQVATADSERANELGLNPRVEPAVSQAAFVMLGPDGKPIQ